MMSDNIAQLLGDEVTGLTYDAQGATGNLFVEDLPADPDELVAVFSSGGSEADARLPYDAPTVQIVIRGGANPTWALGTWSAVYSALHAIRNKTLADGTRLVYALVQQSGPVRMQDDENGRHQFSMNVRTEIVNATGERA